MNFTEKGLVNEDKIVAELNNKKLSDLSNNMRHLIECLFCTVSNDTVIKCYKPTEANIKPDIIIECNNEKKYVSIKIGRAETVHNEIIDNFLNFLSLEGISQQTIETIRLFHFGDGTLDGSGCKRLSYHELVIQLKDRIRIANSELNMDIEFVKRIVRRCVFRGSCISNPEADAIYFGDSDYGVIATQTQVMKHLKRRGFDYYENLHIGPLLLRPDARYVDAPIVSERKRNRIVAYWPNLCADIEYISRRYNY